MTRYSRITIDYRHPEVDLAIIYANGHFDDEVGIQILKAVNELVVRGATSVLLNFSRCDFVDAESSISPLVAAIGSLLEVDGRLAFCGLTTSMEKTFKIMALSVYAPLYPDEEVALASMRI